MTHTSRIKQLLGTAGVATLALTTFGIGAANAAPAVAKSTQTATKTVTTKMAPKKAKKVKKVSKKKVVAADTTIKKK